MACEKGAFVVNARDAILARLRTAGANTRLPRASAPPVAAAPVIPRDAQLARFREELDALGVSCTVETSVEAVRDRVRGLVGPAAVFSWDSGELPYGVGNLFPAAARGSSSRVLQAAADVGLTGCDAAIAETGSLVMLSRPGRSRAASLLPPFHIAIVRPDQLYASMGDFFAARAADVGGGASCTFITGPSRTADIELTLTLGIHGPGRVAVVVGPDDEGAARES